MTTWTGRTAPICSTSGHPPEPSTIPVGVLVAPAGIFFEVTNNGKQQQPIPQVHSPAGQTPGLPHLPRPGLASPWPARPHPGPARHRPLAPVRPPPQRDRSLPWRGQELDYGSLRGLEPAYGPAAQVHGAVGIQGQGRQLHLVLPAAHQRHPRPAMPHPQGGTAMLQALLRRGPG